MTHPSLITFFSDLSDDELLTRIRNGLTLEAHTIASDEAKRRGLDVPTTLETENEPAPYQGDWTLLASQLMPTEAHILASCLSAAGIQVDTADVHVVQNYSLWTYAFGGAKIRVPALQLEAAKQVLKDFQEGEFSIDDDFDVGQATDV